MELPLGKLIVVTGVSGSGKSSLITDTIFPALSNYVYQTNKETGAYKEIIGIENIDKVVNIDQDPIGRSPRSNPATYCGIFTPIRELFAQTVEAKTRGYTAGRFSFNVKGGRCEECEGTGQIVVEIENIKVGHILEEFSAFIVAIFHQTHCTFPLFRMIERYLL